MKPRELIEKVADGADPKQVLTEAKKVSFNITTKLTLTIPDGVKANPREMADAIANLMGEQNEHWNIAHEVSVRSESGKGYDALDDLGVGVEVGRPGVR